MCHDIDDIPWVFCVSPVPHLSEFQRCWAPASRGGHAAAEVGGQRQVAHLGDLVGRGAAEQRSRGVVAGWKGIRPWCEARNQQFDWCEIEMIPFRMDYYG